MEAVVQPVRAVPEKGGRQRPHSPFGITLWLLVSALLNGGGWILSALHQLNARGYAIYVVLAVVVVMWWEQSRGYADIKTPHLRRWIRRFKRPLPAGFLLLAILAFIGG